jgi:RND superfamily putative drug exporter
MKMLGFALAFAVLIDATVMRLAISPALLVLAGRWNWWPGARLKRSDAIVRWDFGLDRSEVK